MFSYQMITTFSSPKRKKNRKTGDGVNWLLPPPSHYAKDLAFGAVKIV